jgi:tRNA(Ile)-lysidine synthetase-like protein
MHTLLEKSHSVRGKKIFVAVSGGLDSVVLLHLINKKFQNSIQVVHINHRLRKSASDADEAFVRDLAKKLQLPFSSYRLKWKKSEKKSQASYRLKRNKIWSQLLSANPDSVIALAHHLDDQAETIFMRLLRGTGVNGLAAMRVDSGNLWRPLLNVSKQELLAYAKVNKISWREDATNRQSVYERNWVRNQIFPLLEAKRPGFARRLSALAKDVQNLPRANKTIAQIRTDWGLLFRATDLRAASGAELQELFGLDRGQIQTLVALLGKASGQFAAKGQRYWLSRNWLLAAPNNVAFPEGEFINTSWNSPLGVWTSKAKNLKPASQAASVKEELRAAGVPLFFKPWVPVLGKKCVLPKSFSKAQTWPKLGLKYQPSLLSQQL